MVKKWYKRWWAITFFIILLIILALILLAAFLILREVKNYQGQGLEGENNFQNQIVYHLKNQKKYPDPEGSDNLNFSLGTTSPRLTIVEFSNFTCPRSGESYSKIRKLGLKYKDKVRVIFRHFPESEESLGLSLASYCAGEQGAFWPMHDKLFQNQGKISPQNLVTLAKQTGLDTNLFSKCLDSQKYQDEIVEDMKDGEEMGVAGTPTWFFNGYKISGDLPYEIMEGIITSLIKEQKK